MVDCRSKVFELASGERLAGLLAGECAAQIAIDVRKMFVAEEGNERLYSRNCLLGLCLSGHLGLKVDVQNVCNQDRIGITSALFLRLVFLADVFAKFLLSALAVAIAAACANER